MRVPASFRLRRRFISNVIHSGMEWARIRTTQTWGLFIDTQKRGIIDRWYEFALVFENVLTLNELTLKSVGAQHPSTTNLFEFTHNEK